MLPAVEGVANVYSAESVEIVEGLEHGVAIVVLLFMIDSGGLASLTKCMEKLLNSSALKKNFNQHLILKFLDFFHTPFSFISIVLHIYWGLRL